MQPGSCHAAPLAHYRLDVDYLLREAGCGARVSTSYPRMSLFDRFSQTVSAAYQALRGGSAVSIPQGAVVIDPIAAWRWTVAMRRKAGPC